MQDKWGKARDRMQKITREAIKQLASSDNVYYRGMRYYAAHAVSNVTWNEAGKQYRAIVKGSNQYVVTVNVGEEDDIRYTCNCPAYVKYAGACKHVVAAMLFISDYQQRELVKETLDDEDKTAYNIVEYFRKREYCHLTPELYHIELQIVIPEFLKLRNSKAYLSFMAGNTRMYKVANTKKFIGDYYNGNTIVLGKEFNFIPDECDFDENSKEVLDYLTEIYEIQETLGKTYYSNLFNRQELVLSKKMLCKVLELAVGMTCRLNLYGKSFEDVNVIKDNPDISMELSLNDDVLNVKGLNENRIISLCDDGSVLFYNNNIYLPEKEFISSLLPFYSSVFKGGEKSVDFKGDNKNSFIEKVLPIIKKSMNVIVPKKLEESYIVENINPRLYLDINHNTKKYAVNATVNFMYGSYEINPLAEKLTGRYIVVRDREEEERLIKILYDLNFKICDDSFVLRNEDDIFEMMTEKSSLLTDNFEVYYSKDYKSISVHKMGQMSASVRMDTDINLLEMDISYSQIPKEELEEFFRAIHLKKKYYRLKNGAFIDLTKEDKQMNSLRWFVENGRQEEGRIKFAKAAAFILDEMLPGGNKIKKDESYKKLLDDMKHPEKVDFFVPDGILAELRKYQRVGYQWLKTLAKYDMGGILADDMGLGKTLQTIVYIASCKGEKTLIVCPTSLSYNWQEEFEKFAPHIRTCIISGTPEERRISLCEHRDDYDVWITTYPLIRKDAALYRDISYDNMFIDEAQFIKNPSSLGAKAVKTVRARHRFALTGTPIENALSELWSIFDFIMPGFFPRYAKFSDMYEKPILKEKNEDKMHELKQRIQPFILRRMKKDVLKDLPDKIETKRIAEMTGKQQKIYLSYLSRIQTEIKENNSLESGKGRIQVLAALTRLRQICCHPATFVDNYHGGSGKMELLMEQLPDILEGGHSVIIFSQFTSMLGIIADALTENNIPYFYLAGATKPADRKRYVAEFNRGDVKVFLISLKAGGTGLNLTGADTVIHFDPWWNPAVEEQATDRAYRIGQKKKVQVIKYVMKDSIEEKIYELQKRKKLLSDSIIEADEVFVNQLTKEELMSLFL